MIFPFQCHYCEADKWLIKYNTDLKFHQIVCVQCGKGQILEEIFGSNKVRGRIKDVKDKLSKQSKKDKVGYDEDIQKETSSEPERIQS